MYINPPTGRCSDGGGYVGVDGVHHAETEYASAVHNYAAEYGALLGGNVTASGAGDDTVVGTGGDGPSGSKGGSREGKDRWGR